MSVAGLICQYCSHRNTGADSRCGHCGAPLPDHHRSSDVEHRAEQVVTGVAKVAAEAAEKAATGAEKVVTQHYPRWQWRLAFGGVAMVLVVLGIAVVRSCSGIPSLPGLGDPQALPEQLRSAASCQRVDPSASAEKCVIRADHPLLAGGITGGRELTLSVQTDPPARLTETVNRWRAAGGTVLSDGMVFVAIGPAATVWYANATSGVRLESGSFTGRAGAQAFLSRSGLRH